MRLADHFKKIGADLKVEQVGSNRTFDLDVQQDIFTLHVTEGLNASILQVDAPGKHLLLLIKDSNGKKHKFLCGHDERAYFVAAIPDIIGVKDVRSAKEALKPRIVLDAQSKHGLNPKYFGDRKTVIYKRQGEWFFVPMPDYFKVPPQMVLKHEPLQRTMSKPHMCEFLYRVNGIQVYLNSKFPNGLTQLQYDEYIHEHPEERKSPWTVRMRDPQVAVMGKITHPDHKTLILPWWHRVASNTEANAASRQYLRFLD